MAWVMMTHRSGYLLFVGISEPRICTCNFLFARYSRLFLKGWFWCRAPSFFWDGELPPIPGARVARPFSFSARAANLAIPGTPVLRGAWSAPVAND